MDFSIKYLGATAVALFGLLGCPKAEVAKEVKPEEETVVIRAPITAMEVIQEFHKSLERDCGETLPERSLEELKKLEIPVDQQAEADELLAEIGLFAQQCASFSVPPRENKNTCNPDCSWCPVKWYWCIYNGGACAGGDNKSCCKLGACGSKHHCKEICKSSCGCDVPPLPADGGGGEED